MSTIKARPSGPPAHYRPKDPRPVTVNLTSEGRVILDAVAQRAKASRADIIEYLLRHYGSKVRFPVEAK